jgi:hypothetical protein
MIFYQILNLTAFIFLLIKLFKTICELNDNNTTINLPNIITRLQDKNCLKKIGIEQIITILNRFENFADLPD